MSNEAENQAWEDAYPQVLPVAEDAALHWMQEAHRLEAEMRRLRDELLTFSGMASAGSMERSSAHVVCAALRDCLRRVVNEMDDHSALIRVPQGKK